jgi:hypothetical protein
MTTVVPKFSLNDALRQEYWRELCPQLHVDGAENPPPVQLPPVIGLLGTFLREGHLNIPDVFPPEHIARLRDAVVTLHRRGIPPLFAFVYDEFWLTTARLFPLVSAVLGSDYRVPRRPTICAWYVEPSDAAAGWKPHRDNPKGFDDAGAPSAITLWVPLTDATPLNGCMYVLPAHLDDAFQRRDFDVAPHVPVNLLQDVRALPASAGSLLAWNTGVLHWGGRASQLGTGPRCSYAFEFVRGGGDIPEGAKPLLRPDEMPTFAERLGLLGRLLQQYERFQKFPAEIKLIAKGLEWKNPTR